MESKAIRRRDFIGRSAAGVAAGCGAFAGLPNVRAAGARTIKLMALPSENPFILHETFGPGDAEGTDINKWLTVLHIDLKNHLDAEGKPALVDDIFSNRFSGEVAIVASLHELSSVEDFTPERWEKMEGADRPWAFQQKDRDSRDGIYIYHSKPLLATDTAGFKWVVALNDEGRIDLSYSDIVKEARLPAGGKHDHFQLGVALDLAPTATSRTVVSVRGHARSFAAWSPVAGRPAVDITYAGTTPNFSWPTPTPWPRGANMSGDGGFIGIGYGAFNR